MKKFCLIILSFVAVFILNSCHKNSDADNADNSHVIINNTAEIISNDIFKLFLYNTMSAEDSILHPNDSLNFRYSEPCMQFAIVPYDTIWPKTITIDFPYNNCFSPDGYQRYGQMVISAKGLLNTIGSEFIVTLNHYSVNGISVSGSKKLTVTQISSGMPTGFNDSCNFNIRSIPGIFDWSAQHQLQWILGSATKSDLTDDLFIYTGTSSSGSFTSVITNSLQFINYCLWIGSGKIEISPSGLAKRNVIYLDSCVNQADVLINNTTSRVNF
jgi:hypothetical protein